MPRHFSHGVFHRMPPLRVRQRLSIAKVCRANDDSSILIYDLEGKHDVRADQRVDQFVRLRDAIEERASRKFFEGPVEAKGPVVLRSNDFFK
jgi:hypothetical protein